MEHKDSQIKIDEYNKYTFERFLERSVYASCPVGIGVESECLLWNGYVSKYGYGQIGYAGKMIGVHIAALMILLKVDSLPAKNANGEKLHAAHKCNVKNCCEPTHMYHATIVENNEDRTRCGSGLGTKNPNAKMTEDVAQAIKLSKGNGTKRDRAERFGVSRSVVNNIDCGSSWGHLPDINGNAKTVGDRLNINKKRRTKRQAKNDRPWTMELYQKVELLIYDNKYTLTHETYSFNGTACKIWIGNALKDGYPETYIDGQTLRMHVVACAIGNNYQRVPDLHAAHECGHSSCVNPLHLTFKTRSENMADKVKHGTDNRKIPTEIIFDIRKRHLDGESRKSIAQLYSLNIRHVGQIINKETRING